VRILPTVQDHPDPLRGTLVRLRAWEPEDHAVAVHLSNDPEVRDGLLSAWPSTPEQQEVRINTGLERGDLAFAIEAIHDGILVGGVSIGPIEPVARKGTLGMFIGKPYWGRGFGTDALRVACRFAFRFANLERLELNVLAANQRAVSVYRKVGFTIEGTRRRSEFGHGRRQDAHLMGLLAEELLEG
jgi:RimJ/RimL family protein N-acetyltransferase